MQTYLAHPYCSWQRGTNEYTNSLLRRYFPKGTDFRLITQEAIDVADERLNNTLRKVLGYQTPQEVFSSELHKAPVLVSLPQQNAPSGLRVPLRRTGGPWRGRHSHDRRDVPASRRTDRQGEAHPP
jgi:hypothetical protein